MVFWFFAPLSVVLVGISKAGFGGGVGIIAVPLIIFATGDPKASLGIMLPILCACDLFAIYHYRKTFDLPNILSMLPGVLIGIGLCGLFLGKLGNDEATNNFLSLMIGVISLVFVVYHLIQTWLFKRLTAYKPKKWHGGFFGFMVGITSTLAHAGGPPATMYLFPQKMNKRLYVGTTVILFTIVNATKLPFYTYHGMIDTTNLQTSLMLLPFVPIGTSLGVWMNRTINDRLFNAVIYTILFLLGLKLTTGFEPISYLISQLRIAV